jgi:hypothetical protein
LEQPHLRFPQGGWNFCTHPRRLATEVRHVTRGEIVTDFDEPCIAWRKSTASNSGGCVEVAIVDSTVLIRDSMNRDGAVLRLSPAAWTSFLPHVRLEMSVSTELS